MPFPNKPWEELEEALELLAKQDPKNWTLRKDTPMTDRYSNQHPRPTVVPSSAVAVPEGVNILPNGTRAGNADRDRAINHITQMADLGYLPPEEAEKRIKHAENIERSADLRTLTSDLPAPIPDKTWHYRYDWDKPAHWIPTLITGMAVSGMTAVIPASVLSAEHLFPNSGAGLGIGIFCLIIGILGFFGCLAGIIVKAND